MTSLSLILLSLAIVTIVLIWLNRHIRDVELQTAGWFGITVCLLLGLILLPWLFKLFLVLVLLVAPTCLWKPVYIRGTCPPLCIARSTCHRSTTQNQTLNH